MSCKVTQKTNNSNNLMANRTGYSERERKEGEIRVEIKGRNKSEWLVGWLNVKKERKEG